MLLPFRLLLLQLLTLAMISTESVSITNNRQPATVGPRRIINQLQHGKQSKSNSPYGQTVIKAPSINEQYGNEVTSHAAVKFLAYHLRRLHHLLKLPNPCHVAAVVAATTKQHHNHYRNQQQQDVTCCDLAHTTIAFCAFFVLHFWAEKQEKQQQLCPWQPSSFETLSGQCRMTSKPWQDLQHQPQGRQQQQQGLAD